MTFEKKKREKNEKNIYNGRSKIKINLKIFKYK